MITRGKGTVVAVVLGLVLALALGAASAWAQPRGIVPLHGHGVAALRARNGTGGVGAAMAGPSSGVPCGNSSPCNPPLLYGGGPVMHSVTTQVITWAPLGYSFPAGYVSGYEQYLNDMAHDVGLSANISSVAAQYVDAGGSALSSMTNMPVPSEDLNPYPTVGGCHAITPITACLTEHQIVSELENLMGGGAFPVDLGHSYVVLLPPYVDTCNDSGTECADNYFCGYHDSFAVGSSQAIFTLLPYTGTYTNYPGYGGGCDGPSGPNGMPADLTALDSIGAHELLESATDPLGTGYLDVAGNEVADECAWTFDPVTPASTGPYNQTVNGSQYLIQDMWSNQDASCVQGDPSPATATVTVTSGGVPEINSPVSFGVTLSGATAATYQWSYDDPFGAVSGAGSGADAQITFPSAGTYTVWVEVADATGGTVTGVTQVTVAAPPRSSFTWSPASPVAKSAVTFSQAASAGTGSITGYSWSFGDGGSSTAADPSYSYASAGTYTVTLTVTQADGLTASAQRSVTVTAPVITPPASPPAAQPPAQPTTQPTAQPAAPSRATIIGSVRRALVPVGGTTIVRLLRTGTAMSVPFKPSVSGEMWITWYAVVKHHRIVVARGSDAASTGVLARVEVRLTSAGRRLLRRSRRLKVTVGGVYRYGTGTIRLTRKITLRH